MEEIGRGAEAVIYREGDSAIKERVRKSYRIPEIDEELRKFRTKREVKVIQKISELGIPTAKVLHEDSKNNKFSMEFLSGPKLRDILNKDNCKEYCSQLGWIVAHLHLNSIIHDDLTTSNMIVVSGKIHIIDFGLSFFSERVEDKAVDIHLLRQALESKHQEIWKEAYDAFIDSYKKNYPEYPKVLERLDVVEMRGRYKQKQKKGPAPSFDTGECE
jgi:Kae1-associated kinase Bud32